MGSQFESTKATAATNVPLNNTTEPGDVNSSKEKS